MWQRLSSTLSGVLPSASSFGDVRPCDISATSMEGWQEVEFNCVGNVSVNRAYMMKPQWNLRLRSWGEVLWFTVLCGSCHTWWTAGGDADSTGRGWPDAPLQIPAKPALCLSMSLPRVSVSVSITAFHGLGESFWWFIKSENGLRNPELAVGVKVLGRLSLLVNTALNFKFS